MKCSCLFVLLVACQDQTITQATPITAPTDTATPGDHEDASTSKTDASSKADGGTVIPPAALCTTEFGNALTSAHGRLDGTVRAVVVPSDRKCQSDEDHVLLQVDVVDAGETVTYPIAINILSDIQATDPAVRLGRTNHALLGAAWSPGWHTDGNLDYALSLGMHDASFVAKAPLELSTTLASELKVGAQVSVYGYGYTNGDGIHKVHRNNFDDDGAIVLISPTPSWFLFHFSQQTF